jgi:hypothetical protein
MPISQLTIIKPHSESQSSGRNSITYVPTVDIFRPIIIIIIIIIIRIRIIVMSII